jgi:hypothetical protein
MSTETRPTGAGKAPAPPAQGTPAAPAPAPLPESAPIPEKWKPLFAELTTYYRHLPELLGEGEAGRYVVIKGDEVCNAWDTCQDALQYGHERFGDQLFMIHRVDRRDLDRLAQFFPPRESSCPP